MESQETHFTVSSFCEIAKKSGVFVAATQAKKASVDLDAVRSWLSNPMFNNAQQATHH
jgi:hypothetical protein